MAVKHASPVALSSGFSSPLSRRVSEFVGVGLFALGLIWLIALASYDANDPAWFFATGSNDVPANFIGRVGAFLAELSFQVLGFASYLLPALVATAGWQYFWCRPIDAFYTKLTGIALTFACASAMLSLMVGSATAGTRTYEAGGFVGAVLASWLTTYLNRPGAIIVIVTLVALAAVLTTHVSFGRLFSAGAGVAAAGGAAVRARALGWIDERRRVRQRREVLAKHAAKEGPDAEPLARGRAVDLASPPPRTRVGTPEAAPGPSASAPVAPSAPPVVARRPVPKVSAPVAAPLPLHESESMGLPPAARRPGAYMLPPPSLLDPAKAERKVDERELMDAARHLEVKCREFSVEGSVVQIHPGPVVTTFEFKPDAGVKYSKVTGLADDLCLAMKAESVLIDRIPGKSTVGIQIPNPNREAISLRELLESETYQGSASKLTHRPRQDHPRRAVHGRSGDHAASAHRRVDRHRQVGGPQLDADQHPLPRHARRRAPDHDRPEAARARDVRRHPASAHAGRRRSEEGRQRAALGGARNGRALQARWRPSACATSSSTTATCGTCSRTRPRPTAPDAPKLLPFIVVVIDELADLMMVAGNEVEESICRLAQMARAVGIHLILATQRPSVDVITGLIKANLPSRISFRVPSKIDSRTILDGNGAEQLLGKGDMLFLPPATSRTVRLHGPYISEQEIGAARQLPAQAGPPAFDENITADEKTEKAGIEYEKDDLYDEAARMVVQSGQVSISSLQRKLRVGFSRAARLVDMMEAEGDRRRRLGQQAARGAGRPRLLRRGRSAAPVRS